MPQKQEDVIVQLSIYNDILLKNMKYKKLSNIA